VGGMPAKVGVLVEVNCESDFVAKTDDFKRLARELPLQVPEPSPCTSARRMSPRSPRARA